MVVGGRSSEHLAQQMGKKGELCREKFPMEKFLNIYFLSLLRQGRVQHSRWWDFLRSRGNILVCAWSVRYSIIRETGFLCRKPGEWVLGRVFDNKFAFGAGRMYTGYGGRGDGISVEDSWVAWDLYHFFHVIRAGFIYLWWTLSGWVSSCSVRWKKNIRHRAWNAGYTWPSLKQVSYLPCGKVNIDLYIVKIWYHPA